MESVWAILKTGKNCLNRKWNYSPTSRPLIKNFFYKMFHIFSKGVWDCFSKQEMESFKQEMELFILSFLNPSYFFAAYGGSSLFRKGEQPCRILKITRSLLKDPVGPSEGPWLVIDSVGASLVSLESLDMIWCLECRFSPVGHLPPPPLISWGFFKNEINS